MSHHHHEFGQLPGWPHEFTRADFGDTVETPEEEEESPDEAPAPSHPTSEKHPINFEMIGRLGGS